MSLRVAIVVHGRFHGFDLARALLKAGVETQVFTNYPRRVAARFGLPPERVTGCVWHGIAARLLQRCPRFRGAPIPLEAWVHRAFSRWAAGRIRGADFDVVHCFSGIAEELWQRLGRGGPLRALVRGSAHIETQHDILAEEERLTGVALEKPSPWMRAREAREYAMSDLIIVLSRFAKSSFIERGLDVSKVDLVPLGSELSCFRASRETLAARKERILAGGPLRVLTVGTWSMQKGVPYLIQTARALGPLARCRFVGAIGQDARHLLPEARTVMEFCPRVPQHELPGQYAWGDVFLFPTLQDGFAVVLAQAQAAGLPLLATPNCAAPELVSEGRTGWIRPIRDAAGYAEQLRWCAAHREQLAAMVDAVAASHTPRDWQTVAQDFLAATTVAIDRGNPRTAAGNLR